MSVAVARAEESPVTNFFQDIYLARQPILDREKKLIGYELLFRSCGANAADIVDDMRATMTVVHNAFNGLGVGPVLGHASGYINVNAEFLLSDLIETLPPRQIVLEILESVRPTDELMERVRALREKGYSFALDDYAGDPGTVGRLLDEVDVVKVDIREMDSARLAHVATDLRQRRVRMVAEKVETREDFEHALGLGFDMFQGYHFARPQVMSAKQLRNPAKVLLLRLLTLIVSDADTSALEAEFKKHLTLSYNLLRMVNSAAGGLRERVNSLRHAIVLLGRRQLERWMQLLLYTAGEGGASGNPLMQMAATRGKFMETLAKADPQSTREDHDAAFMTGILSLVDVLLEMPREEVLAELMLPDEVKQALLARVGPLGYLLRLSESLEEDNRAELKDLIAATPGLALEDLLQMQLEAFYWANNIERDSN